MQHSPNFFQPFPTISHLFSAMIDLLPAASSPSRMASVIQTTCRRRKPSNLRLDSLERIDDVQLQTSSIASTSTSARKYPLTPKLEPTTATKSDPNLLETTPGSDDKFSLNTPHISSITKHTCAFFGSSLDRKRAAFSEFRSDSQESTCSTSSTRTDASTMSATDSLAERSERIASPEEGSVTGGLCDAMAPLSVC